MLRRKVWLFLFMMLAGSVALAWQETALNDGTAHGDAPYLLEPAGQR